MQEFIELLQTLGFVGWPLMIMGSIKLFGMDKKAGQFYDNIVEPWLIKKINLQDEAMRHKLSRYVDDETAGYALHSNYMSIARHIITSSWRIKQAYIKGDLSEDALLLRLRTDAHDMMDKARTRLHEKIHFDTKNRLDIHLRNLTEEQTRLFYAPIIATIADANELKQHDYEALRFTVLAEMDNMYADAVDIVTLESTKKGDPNG